MGNPLISCIVPTYNGQRFIGETIRSIVAQTYPTLEVIVANDGSCDGTLEIASGFGDPVRVISQSRGGPAAARNFGLSEAQGEFIAFLDHDDLWLPEKLELQMAAFDADPDLDVCVGHIQRFRDGGGKDVMEKLGEPLPGYLTTTMLAKRQGFDRVGPLDGAREQSDSADWFVRAAGTGLSVRLLSEVLTFHRVHDSNLSRTHSLNAHREFLNLAKSWIDRKRSLEQQIGEESPRPASERRQ